MNVPLMPHQADHDRLIDYVVRALETMKSAQQAHRLYQFVSPDVTYNSPLMHTRGRDGLSEAMRAIFDGANDGIIRVTDRAWGQDERTVYLRWDRLLNLPDGSRHVYSGVSEIMVGLDGKIASIIDHWDGANRPQMKQVGLLRRLLKR